MLLENIGISNDLSPKFRTELEDKVRKMGGATGVIRFKFYISNDDPDPDKKGQKMWPWLYTLTPKTFNVQDPYEDRPNKQKVKRIVLVDQIENTPQGMVVSKVRSVKIEQKSKGILELRVNDSTDDFDYAMYLLLHPANINGQFKDPKRQSVFELLDDKADAQERNKNRSVKVKALLVVEKMTLAELREFAAAMAWEDTDADIIRDQAQALAESSPEMLLSLLDENNKTIEYKATIKKATDKSVIYFDNSDYSYKYMDTRVVIYAAEPSGEGQPIDKLAFWFINGGEKAEAAYKKLKASLK